MFIDVILASYNRAALLERAVLSLLDARRDGSFAFAVTVVDNNSSDATRAVVERLARASDGRVRYLHEARQGKSYAVNAGIAATSGEVIALADDDQEMDGEWLCAIARALRGECDYVTGRVLGAWEVAQPAWYDARLGGAVSLHDGGTEGFAHEDERAGLSGGNAALKRAALVRVGGYSTQLGKRADGFGMCEDGELLLRLRAAGMRGRYEPAMVVRHRVPAERVSKGYFRRWQRDYGASMAVLDNLHPKPVTYWRRVPRFLVRRWLEAPPRWLRARLRGDLPGAFEQELHFWFALGFLQTKLTTVADATRNQYSPHAVN